ncbi:hypothetical protein E1B28_000088 [Marasmius oreades]|uniref:Uncharacterized protein n=1 Tax=Marasmius oreades TaxID=181124 RepID=A0A9P7V0P9_9AGAR|nr:uncharacterized protein E1B28_000088 [Marasmius oreades]KAG7098116.1 hypothetical protein E1B28_000088 [Marasmius oreades]
MDLESSGIILFALQLTSLADEMKKSDDFSCTAGAVNFKKESCTLSPPTPQSSSIQSLAAILSTWYRTLCQCSSFVKAKELDLREPGTPPSIAAYCPSVHPFFATLLLLLNHNLTFFALAVIFIVRVYSSLGSNWAPSHTKIGRPMIVLPVVNETLLHAKIVCHLCRSRSFPTADLE